MRNQLPPQIRKVTLDSGKLRYELIVDTGSVAGRRKQVRRRFKTEQEARKQLAEVQAAVHTGNYVHKRRVTVKEVIDLWLEGKTGIRRTSWTHLRDYLQPVTLLYGDMPVQNLKKQDIDKLLGLLQAGDLPRANGQPRKPWSGRSRKHLLTALSRVLESEVKQGHLVRNVAALVDVPRIDKKPRLTFDVKQLQILLELTKDDQTGIAWQLGSMGLRRSEIAGIRWQDIDMDARTMNICHTRVAVDGHDVESVPKTEAGRRTLPIPTTLYSALLHARAMQTRQRMNAGGQYVDSGYVVVDELGLPYRTQNLTKQWRKTCDRLGLPRITLHDERHTCATLHILNGANPAVMKVWLGHTSIRFMYDTYVHSQPDGLLKIAEAHAELARVVTLLDDKKPA